MTEKDKAEEYLEEEKTAKEKDGRRRDIEKHGDVGTRRRS